MSRKLFIDGLPDNQIFARDHKRIVKCLNSAIYSTANQNIDVVYYGFSAFYNAFQEKAVFQSNIQKSAVKKQSLRKLPPKGGSQSVPENHVKKDGIFWQLNAKYRLNKKDKKIKEIY